MVSILIQNNLLYTKHTIVENFLSELPEDGLVLEILPKHDKDENNINDNSFCVSSQETEIDRIPVESKISCGPE